jgi:chorismate mutase
MQVKTTYKMKSINNIREEIDKIDEKIVKLLQERVKKVKEIKAAKTQSKSPIFDEKREKEIKNKLTTKYEKEIFKKIIEESRKLQEYVVVSDI